MLFCPPDTTFLMKLIAPFFTRLLMAAALAAPAFPTLAEDAKPVAAQPAAKTPEKAEVVPVQPAQPARPTLRDAK